MLSFLTGLSTAVSRVLGFTAALMVLALILVTLVEVFSRYVLKSPTIWVFDVAYMLNGSAFILAAAATQAARQHVVIDVFSAMLPLRVQHVMQGLAMLLLITPALGWLAWVAAQQAHFAWTSGEIEHLSAWRPKMWPFRTVLAIGLCALLLQIFTDGLLLLARIRRIEG